MVQWIAFQTSVFYYNFVAAEVVPLIKMPYLSGMQLIDAVINFI